MEVALTIVGQMGKEAFVDYAASYSYPYRMSKVMVLFLIKILLNILKTQVALR